MTSLQTAPLCLRPYSARKLHDLAFTMILVLLAVRYAHIDWLVEVAVEVGCVNVGLLDGPAQASCVRKEDPNAREIRRGSKRLVKVDAFFLQEALRDEASFVLLWSAVLVELGTKNDTATDGDSSIGYLGAVNQRVRFESRRELLLLGLDACAPQSCV